MPAAKEALEKTLRAVTLDKGQWPPPNEVDGKLQQWTAEVLASLAARSPGIRYGRAAKLVAVYLKEMVVTGPHADHAFARLLHPPIDGILLRGLATALKGGSLFRDCVSAASKARLGRALTGALKNRPFNLDACEYCELIVALREAHLDRDDQDQHAFWFLERFWTPDREGP